MFQLPKDNPKIKDCCKVAENLKLAERNGPFEKYICSVCQCKHIRLHACDRKKAN